MAKSKILIVEDEPIIAKEIAMNLEDNGFEISGIAHNSEKALEYLFNKDIDLAILDIAIAGNKNGLELGDIINTKYKIPFIYLTSFADKDTINQAANTYPEGYIVKPFKEDDIAPVINIALKRYRSRSKAMPALEELNYGLKNQITKSEYKVIEKIYEGKLNTDIADELYISINTVKKHTNNIYRKLGVDRKPQLLKYLQELL